MKRIALLLGLAAGLAAPAPAAPSPSVAAHVGPAVFFSPLAVAVVPRLEAGIEITVAGRPLQVFALGSYAAPKAGFDGSDPRLPDGGAWSGELRQRILAVGAGATMSVLPPDAAFLTPEVTVAPVLLLMETVVDAQAAGASFGENREQYARAGVLAAVGAGRKLGPGLLVVQVGTTVIALDGEVTGESTATGLCPTAGYRMRF